MSNRADEGSGSSRQRPNEPSTSEQVDSPVGSLVSLSSSSSRRQAPRIIELLEPDQRKNDEDSQDEDWRISEEFYLEDLIADYAGDQSDHSDVDDDANMTDGDSPSDDQDEEDESEHEGYVFAAPNQQSDTESNDEDEAINYDITLPIGHRYLGDHLEEARGRQVFAESSVVSLTLINMPLIVLLPGQELPISTRNINPRIHMYLKDCITTGKSLIGLISNPQENHIGTTAEIRRYIQQEEELRIIMQGRQRFEMLSHPFETLIEGTVRLLPEVSLGRPYQLTPSRRRFLTHDFSAHSKLIVSKHPRWLLQQHDSHYLVKKIREQIEGWCNVDPVNNPNDFSYWVAANLPISNQERMQVLKFSCTEERLLWLKDMLRRCEYFGCRYCNNVICDRKDMFLMSCSGPQNSFVNSHGFVHDTLTVRAARGLMREYDWSTEYSWFPGYAWKVACCANCSRHIGWCYKSLGAELKPKRFFGLSRASLRLQSSDQEMIERDDLSLVVF